MKKKLPKSTKGGKKTSMTSPRLITTAGLFALVLLGTSAVKLDKACAQSQLKAPLPEISIEEDGKTTTFTNQATSPAPVAQSAKTTNSPTIVVEDVVIEKPATPPTAKPVPSSPLIVEEESPNQNTNGNVASATNAPTTNAPTTNAPATNKVVSSANQGELTPTSALKEDKKMDWGDSFPAPKPSDTSSNSTSVAPQTVAAETEESKEDLGATKRGLQDANVKKEKAANVVKKDNGIPSLAITDDSLPTNSTPSAPDTVEVLSNSTPNPATNPPTAPTQAATPEKKVAAKPVTPKKDVANQTAKKTVADVSVGEGTKDMVLEFPGEKEEPEITAQPTPSPSITSTQAAAFPSAKQDPNPTASNKGDMISLTGEDKPNKVANKPKTNYAPKTISDEEEINRLIEKLQKEALSKEVAKSTQVNNQVQDEINYDNAPLGSLLRLLAQQAGFNYVAPMIDGNERISVRFQNMRPLDAFIRVAKARGFRIITENGVTTLKRSGDNTPEFMVVKKYKLHFTQPKWVIQEIANLLDIKIVQPRDILQTYPSPGGGNGWDKATGFGSAAAASSGGGSGGGGGNGSSGSTAGGQNIGLPTSPRWLPSLPYDEPAYTSQGKEREQSYVFVDRSANAIVVKTTEEKQKMVSDYLKEADVPEPQIEIETKIVDVELNDQLLYGVNWAGVFQSGISVTASGASINLLKSMTTTGTLFLTVPQVQATLQAFQTLGKANLLSMPRTVTRSGVPVQLSSAQIQSFQAQQFVTGTATNASSGSSSLPSGYNTFTTGITIDVVPTLLDNGMVDLNVNPTVANVIPNSLTGNINNTNSSSANSSTNNSPPTIGTRSITTSAVVPSGMTVMVGGLTQGAHYISQGGIPILCKMPILGKTLFGNSTTQKVNTTVVIFITPKVIYPNEYQKIYTDRQMFEAIREGEQFDVHTETDAVPKRMLIKKASKLKSTLNYNQLPQ
jgi:Flp pilus assembly secretin CpaC